MLKIRAVGEPDVAVAVAGAVEQGRLLVIGDPSTVRRGIAAFAERTGADELMLTSQAFDHAARLRSFEIPAVAGG